MGSNKEYRGPLEESSEQWNGGIGLLLETIRMAERYYEEGQTGTVVEILGSLSKQVTMLVAVVVMDQWRGRGEKTWADALDDMVSQGDEDEGVH